MSPDTCPQCGAVYEPSRTCESVFNQFLALEFTDPRYGAVHFLTVACYMIQHGQYSPDALAWIEAQLRGYLEEGRSVQQIRRQASSDAGQAQRRWKVTRQENAPPQPKVAWSMTILDVALLAKDAESYQALVKQWAGRTLQDMQPLVRRP